MFDNIFAAIEKWMRELLTGMVESNMSTMFTDVNEKTSEIAAQVGRTPQNWNSSVFSMIQNLSESVVVPIAGIIITLVLCYELISMLTERNNLHDVDTWMFFKYFVKAWVAIYLVSNRCFSGKAPFIESEKIFREILSALEKEKMQAAHIDRVLDLNPEKVKQCMDAGLLQYRKRANEIVAHLMAKDDERTAVYREYEQGSISLEQVEEYEHQYQVAIQKQEAAFKKVMLAVNDIEKAFSHGNPWLMKFRAISIPEKLERTHLKEWLDHVWIVDFEQVEVILQESEWKGFFPEEWLNNGEEDFNGKKE